MIAPIRIPTRNQGQPIVDDKGRATPEFHRWLNDILGQIVLTLNAAVLAQQAAVVAQQAADNAQAAADAAQAAADAAGQDNSQQSLASSGIMPRVVVSATSTGVVSIAAHTRYYADGTTRSVDAGSLTDTYLPSDQIYVSYVDPTRVGGAVTYEGSMTFQSQTGDRHVVGSVVVPSTGMQQGEPGPPPPGGA